MKATLAFLAACILLLAILLFSTDPNRVFPFVLIIPFLLLFAGLVLAGSTFFQRRGFSRLRSLRMAAFLAALPVMLLVFQSIGQLTPRDILTILLLFAILYFYVSRANARIS